MLKEYIKGGELLVLIIARLVKIADQCLETELKVAVCSCLLSVWPSNNNKNLSRCFCIAMETDLHVLQLLLMVGNAFCSSLELTEQTY